MTATGVACAKCGTELRPNAKFCDECGSAAIGRLAESPTDTGFVLYELPLLRLRALLARAHHDEQTYREFVPRYRAMATTLEFDGHIAIAGALT